MLAREELVELVGLLQGYLGKLYVPGEGFRDEEDELRTVELLDRFNCEEETG